MADKDSASQSQSTQGLYLLKAESDWKPAMERSLDRTIEHSGEENKREQVAPADADKPRR